MSKPIRILHVIHGLGSGGAEAIIMNWYRHIDRSKVQFDFLVRSAVNDYADEISELGGKVFVMPPFPKCFFANARETKRFFAEHAKEYVGIHVHGNALLYVNIFNFAKKYGINLRIFHSHSVNTAFLYYPLHVFNRLRIRKLATDYLACSKAAGKWAFSNLPYTVVNNGIAIDQFTYNKTVREQIRASLGITNETVYGHVGRFVPVKNHSFLLEVFKKIVQQDENSRLLLLGDGELFETVKMNAQQLGIANKIIFMGRQNNVGRFMNAMDVFMLPSLFEGISIVAVEAQAAGLPTLLSDSITREVELTDLVRFIPISDSDAWANLAMEMSRTSRKITEETIRSAGFDIAQSSELIENFYCSRVM